MTEDDTGSEQTDASDDGQQDGTGDESAELARLSNILRLSPAAVNLEKEITKAKLSPLQAFFNIDVDEDGNATADLRTDLLLSDNNLSAFLALDEELIESLIPPLYQATPLLQQLDNDVQMRLLDIELALQKVSTTEGLKQGSAGPPVSSTRTDYRQIHREIVDTPNRALNEKYYQVAATLSVYFASLRPELSEEGRRAYATLVFGLLVGGLAFGTTQELWIALTSAGSTVKISETAITAVDETDFSTDEAGGSDSDAGVD